MERKLSLVGAKSPISEDLVRDVIIMAALSMKYLNGEVEICTQTGGQTPGCEEA